MVFNKNNENKVTYICEWNDSIVEWEKYWNAEVYRRTFWGGSNIKEEIRDIYNRNPITSWYMTSHKYVCRYWIWENWANWDDFYQTFATKREAIEFAKQQV